jgi:hypothetical protein
MDSYANLFSLREAGRRSSGHAIQVSPVGIDSDQRNVFHLVVCTSKDAIRRNIV